MLLHTTIMNAAAGFVQTSFQWPETHPVHVPVAAGAIKIGIGRSPPALPRVELAVVAVEGAGDEVVYGVVFAVMGILQAALEF